MRDFTTSTALNVSKVAAANGRSLTRSVEHLCRLLARNHTGAGVTNCSQEAANHTREKVVCNCAERESRQTQFVVDRTDVGLSQSENITE